MNKKSDKRKIQVLKHIVESYLDTGEVLWSKSLLKQYNLGVSSATIRNDMASLEKMGLIFQPYNSAWRLPTNRWIRVFVDYLMEDMPNTLLYESNHCFGKIRDGLIDDIMYSIVEKLTHTTREITFACIPWEWVLTYLGISHLLKNTANEQKQNIIQIVELLEQKNKFVNLLESLRISSKVSVYMSDENSIKHNEEALSEEILQNIVIIAKKIEFDGHSGYIGIIGWIKMDYAFNIATIRQVL